MRTTILLILMAACDSVPTMASKAVAPCTPTAIWQEIDGEPGVTYRVEALCPADGDVFEATVFDCAYEFGSNRIVCQ